MSKRKPYVRPMAGWWKKNPVYGKYMAQEWVSLFIGIYAFILLTGLVCLCFGESAWNCWLAIMRNPLSLIVHFALLLAMLYHIFAWFKVMPITMPPITFGEKQLSACAITTGGLLAAAASNLILFVLIWSIV